MIPSVSEHAATNFRKGKRPAVQITLDRLPPWNNECEMGVLGCCLQSPNECVDEAVLKLGAAGASAFYDLRHQKIFEVLVQMRNDGDQIDLITVQAFLKTEQMLEQIGGITYLSQLQDSVPSVANLGYYLEHLKEKYLLRQMIQTCSGVVGRIYDYEGEVDKLMSEIESTILKIGQMFERGRAGVDIGQVQDRLIQIYEDALNKKAAPGLLTGYADLDRKLGGALPQEMIVIGGTPSSGKTALALGAAIKIAQGGTVVSLKSLETSATKIVHRANCIVGRVNSSGFLNGDPTESEMVSMIHAVGQVKGLGSHLMIQDEVMSDVQLMASCRQDYQRGARLFVVDMLQNILTGGRTEFDQVTQASRCIKRIAKELNVPVIVTSALNRPEKNKKSGKPARPTMHDLRQSGQIESDADKILLLHCENREEEIRQVDCSVAKNKDGPLGNISFTFFASQFRFEPASPIADEDVPGWSSAPDA